MEYGREPCSTRIGTIGLRAERQIMGLADKAGIKQNSHLVHNQTGGFDCDTPGV
jgi:hypothetical protein